MGPIRLPAIPEDQLTPEQRSLMSAIASGPRGTFKMSGPFFCYLHAPGFGELAQKLGAYLPLRHLDRAAADRIRDPRHRAVAGRRNTNGPRTSRRRSRPA